MKKIYALVLVSSLVLAACGGNGTSTEVPATDTTSVDSTTVVDTTAAPAVDSTAAVK